MYGLIYSSDFGFGRRCLSQRDTLGGGRLCSLCVGCFGRPAWFRWVPSPIKPPSTSVGCLTVKRAALGLMFQIPTAPCCVLPRNPLLLEKRPFIVRFYNCYHFSFNKLFKSPSSPYYVLLLYRLYRAANFICSPLFFL